ncbi:MAG: SBBP repeat-containing protein [Flavipsychrobacter sp.]|nr:SBBP repeat-containing protein [Flavipsychrobacter sp.]
MKHPYYRISLVSVLFCFLLLSSSPCFAFPGNAIKHTPAEMMEQQQVVKLLFTENNGQVKDDKGKVRPDILFTAHSGGAQLYFTAAGINYQFIRLIKPEGYDKKDIVRQTEISGQIKAETCMFSLSLEGANQHPKIRKENKNTFTENFYTTVSGEGITKVATYEKIVYENVYPNVDWIIYSNGNRLKYDFIVHPGGNPKQIRLKIKDAKSVQITPEGELLMKTALGEIKEKAPESFANNEHVKTKFRKNNDGTIGFDVNAPSGKELRIDPYVTWATYYGGSDVDCFYSCAADASGNLYATGYTYSNNGIASPGSYYSMRSTAVSGMIVKFNANGNRLWATYYDSVSASYPLGDGTVFYGCAVDPNSNVYASGSDQQFGAVLVKFSPSGTMKWTLRWATNYILCSGAAAKAGACCTDHSGNVFLTGWTECRYGVVAGNAFKSYPPDVYSHDAFLAKFDSSGNVQWGTYYGLTGTFANGFLSDDYGTSVVCDDTGNVYMGGNTDSDSDIASPGAFDTVKPSPSGQNSTFIAKFDAYGNRKWATYGYAGNMSYQSLATDATGNIYLSGSTAASGYATSGAYQTTNNGGNDAYLAKFNGNGSHLWTTYFGGSGNEDGKVFTDKGAYVYLTGVTASNTNIIPSCSYQNTYGGNSDGYIAKFDTSGNIQWATYYGGNNADVIYSGAADTLGNVYVVGSTTSTSGIATANSYQDTLGGSIDGFISRLSNNYTVSTGIVSSSTGQVGNTYCPGATIIIPFGSSLSGNSCTTPSSVTFFAQLSDNTGSFASPVNIGTYTATTGDTITGIIPMNTPQGNGYRIRVICNVLGSTSFDNGTNITVNGPAAIPVFNSGASSTRCIGAGVVTYTATALYSNGITYSLDSASLAAGNSINSATGTATYIAGWGGPSEITATATGCNGSIAAAIHRVSFITTPPLPGAFITSTDSVCVKHSGVYVIPTDTFTHAWSYTGTGASISGGGDSVYISFNNTATSGFVRVNSSNVCGTTLAYLTKNVVVNTNPVVSVTGNSFFCEGGSDTLTATGATSYTWSPTATALGGDIFMVTPPVNPVTVYTVIGKQNGCTDTITVSLTKVYNPVVTITGASVICIGKADTLKASGGSYYVWYPSSTLSSSTGSSVIANSAVTTTYNVVGFTAQHCTDTAIKIVTVVPLPNDSIITDTPYLCPGKTLLISAATDTSYHYQWQLNGTNLNVTASALLVSDSGSYDVRITNAACTVTSAVIHVVEVSAQLPIITITGTQLCVQHFAKYQWYLDGTPIQGDSTQCINIISNGVYTVNVINDSGCSGSVILNVNVGFENVQKNPVELYPNPTTGLLNIKSTEKVSFIVSSLDGRELMRGSNVSQIDMSKLPDAIYLIKIYDRNNNLLKLDKLVKAAW